jgi:carboxyl-terminal processing protease
LLFHNHQHTLFTATAPTDPSKQPQLNIIQTINRALFTAAATTTLLLSPLPAISAQSSAQPSIPPTSHIKFPIADDPSLFNLQKTLFQAWAIISEAYVDPTLNHLDWPRELSAKLSNIASASSPSSATREISSMIQELDDPYTRWVPAEEYNSFRVSSDGELQGVGLLIAQDRMSGRLLVLSPIKGSPAERAGLLPGDEVVSVDGNSTRGMDETAAAKVLRGQQGSSVMVEVARRRGNNFPATPALLEAIPGVAGMRSSDPYEQVEYKKFRLRRGRAFY